MSAVLLTKYKDRPAKLIYTLIESLFMEFHKAYRWALRKDIILIPALYSNITTFLFLESSSEVLKF